MGITLNLDDETAERALALARERALTVDQLVSELLRRACDEGPGDAFALSADRYHGRSEPGWRFNRAECWGRDGRW